MSSAAALAAGLQLCCDFQMDSAKAKCVVADANSLKLHGFPWNELRSLRAELLQGGRPEDQPAESTETEGGRQGARAALWHGA